VLENARLRWRLAHQRRLLRDYALDHLDLVCGFVFRAVALAYQSQTGGG
jgi:hypothetical protein